MLLRVVGGPTVGRPPREEVSASRRELLGRYSSLPAGHVAAERPLQPADEGEAQLQRDAEHQDADGEQHQPVAEGGQQLGLAQDDGNALG